ncbi:MAG: hypothetical protein JXA00_04930 [Candidatus Thermoplasmatota archaeon]|nr:hypothetical protein [Candidatus Thermoplasmatota archaeon]
MKQKKLLHRSHPREDEKGHPHSVLEWWSIEAFFQSHEDKKRWSVKVAMSEGFGDPQHRQQMSVFNMTVFDEDANKYYEYYRRIPQTRLQQNPEVFDVQYEQSFMRGSYPLYQMKFHDPDHEITLEFTSQAESQPHWVAQEATKGWLPMGVGFYRYWFIPKTRISGTLRIQQKQYTIEGTGYLEHVWGSFDYEHPLSTASGLLSTLWVYKKLVFWWLQNRTIRLPKSLGFSTENNPLGYDWIWGVFDNGWSVFYGNALFWIMKGPAAGILIFSKDGETYTEFSDISFQYTNTVSAKEHDFVYPTAIQLRANKGKETLALTCTMTCTSREYIRIARKNSFWSGLAICEAPGLMTGSYSDGHHTTPLTGVCKIEPQRELSCLGHNMMTIEFIRPPKGVGLSAHVESHFFKKNIDVLVQFAPVPKLQWKHTRLTPPSFSHRNR